MKLVAVIGEGRLAMLAASMLSGKLRIHRQADLQAELPAGASLALVLQDRWTHSWPAEAEARMREAGASWIGAAIRRDEAVIGPLVTAGTAGCALCADTRMQLAERDREEQLSLRVSLLLHGAAEPDGAVTDSAYRFAAQTVCRVVHAALDPAADIMETRLVRIIRLRTLETTRHRFLPDPSCPSCGGLPEDSAGGARILPAHLPKLAAASYRTKAPDGLKALTDSYLDERTGLFNAKHVETGPAFALTAFVLPTEYGTEVATGRAFNYVDSGRYAILEGLERYCGIRPRGKKTAVRGSFAQLSSDAIDPATVGVYSEAQYADEDFPYRPFDPERPIDWVWGYSLLRERPVLVPERLAYYSVDPGESFVQEGSNGCALGGCLEEAVFHGMLEAAERDAFLLAWYAQLPLPRIDPYSSPDRELSLMALRMRNNGYDVLLFDARTEVGIPCIWAVARSRDGKEPNLACAAGAHPDPVQAAKSAVHELAGHLPWLAWRMETERVAAIALLRDSSLVRRMEDHSLVYAVREAEGRLAFLLQSGNPMRSFGELFPPPENRPDMSAELAALVRTFGHAGLDVIAVDQTAPETLRHGLHCAKVLVPGMLPMTFGHRMRRLEGLDRLLRVPAELGYRDGRMAPGELNPYPHPFL